MEGVGARFGRSSTRYGPTTAFVGPVRKWKKKWVHVSPSSSSNSNANHSQSHHRNGSASNGNFGSHLKLYRWTPISQTGSGASPAKDDGGDAALAEEPPRRKFKYIPIAVLEEHKSEAAEKVEEEDELNNNESSEMEPSPKKDAMVEKPDINDIPMEDNEADDDNPLLRQDLNESTLDLSLGMTARESDHGDPESEAEVTRDGL